ncbi:MAG: AMP-binding protein [Ignavibacteriales bacterium]|nr:AMP-binding protein [Ignavibacteriales bacterium]
MTSFLNIPSKGITKSYSDLITDLNRLESIPKILHINDEYEIYLSILAAACNGNNIVLTDSGLTKFELLELGITDENANSVNHKTYSEIDNPAGLLEKIKNEDWSLTLFTSGTTGKPKSVTHKISSFLRSVKTGKKFENNIWGLCYHPTHIAGINVFFQALFNLNQIVFLFDLPKEGIKKQITEAHITHLSATPSFYRQLLPSSEVFGTVMYVTSGGERYDEKLTDELKKIFVNAKFRNIYASTEAGTIFTGDGDNFRVKEDSLNLLKIVENKLFLHRSLLGASENLICEGDWYDSGDIVEVINRSPMTIKFVSRQNDFVNIGGFKVNPLEVEEILRSHQGVVNARVFGKKNSVLGNILVAEIQPESKAILEERELREFLRLRVQEYKIPRMFIMVEELEMTRTGKISRK